MNSVCYKVFSFGGLNFVVNFFKSGGVLEIQKGEIISAGISFEKIEIEEILEDTKSYLFKNKNRGIEVCFYDLDEIISIVFYSASGQMEINERLGKGDYCRLKSIFEDVYCYPKGVRADNYRQMLLF